MNNEPIENIDTEQDAVTAEPNLDNRSFTQEEVDRIVKERLDRERKKFEKRFADVDPDKYKELLTKEEQQRTESMKARGEFEKVLQETVEKKQSVISQLQAELRNIKVDGSLLSAASSRKAINAKQVASLLKEQVRMNENGEVEIIDVESGQVRYNDAGRGMNVEDLVQEFLQANAHFVSAGPPGSGSQTSVGPKTSQNTVDSSKLNMADPKDRQIYRDMMKAKGIRI